MTKKQMQQIDAGRASGQTYKEISESLGIPVSTIKSYFARATVQPKQEPMVIRKCQYCGTALEQKTVSRSARFCGNRCYRLWWEKHAARPRTVYEKVCAGCGKPFSTVSKKNQKYCSAACFYASRKAGTVHD